MIITAEFRGKDGSLGYRKGIVYTLMLQEYPIISISRIDGSGWCTYSSITAFLINWANIDPSKEPETGRGQEMAAENKTILYDIPPATAFRYDPDEKRESLVIFWRASKNHR